MEEVNIFRFRGGQVVDRTITEVVVEPGVRSIDESAFRNCKKLAKIRIPESVKFIHNRAFQFCCALKEIIIPEGVTKINDRAFEGCSSLHTVVLPNSLTRIGMFCFSHCSSLKRINIPSQVTIINVAAFARTGIEQVVLPNGVIDIHRCAFHLCQSLRTVELPASLEFIGALAFGRCDSLKYFIFPKDGQLTSLTSISLAKSYEVNTHDWQVISRLIARAPNLKFLTLRSMRFKPNGNQRLVRKLNENDIPMILEMILACPSLRYLDLSNNDFTNAFFEKLASHGVPDHLRELKIFETTALDRTCTRHFVKLLKGNPKLVIWARKFWDDSDDEMISHLTDINHTGCRGFVIPECYWPRMIEKLGSLDRIKKLETGAPNIVFHFLRQHLEVLVGH